MKIRKGFVANSSTTSFVIYGIYDEDYCEDNEEEGEDLDHAEILADKLTKAGIGHDVSCYYPPDEGVYVGVSWADVKDNETGKQFKDTIEQAFKKVLGEDVEVKTFQEGWRDG